MFQEDKEEGERQEERKKGEEEKDSRGEEEAEKEEEEEDDQVEEKGDNKLGVDSRGHRICHVCCALHTLQLANLYALKTQTASALLNKICVVVKKLWAPILLRVFKR